MCRTIIPLAMCIKSALLLNSQAPSIDICTYETSFLAFCVSVCLAGIITSMLIMALLQSKQVMYLVLTSSAESSVYLPVIKLGRG